MVVPPKDPNYPTGFCPFPDSPSALREDPRKGHIISDLTPSQAARRTPHGAKRSLPYVPVQNPRHSWATNAGSGSQHAVVSKDGRTDIKTTARFYATEIASLKEAQSIWERALIEQ